MKWIASEGGPLILMEERLLPSWTGCFSADDSDYDRACAVDDYAGVIRAGEGSALVLGDEPCQATFWSRPPVEHLIVRWQCADSEGAVESCLKRMDKIVFDGAQTIDLFVESEKLILFDATLSGNDEIPEIERLEIDLRPGRYHIRTVVWQPDDQTSLILHGMIGWESMRTVCEPLPSSR